MRRRCIGDSRCGCGGSGEEVIAKTLLGGLDCDRSAFDMNEKRPTCSKECICLHLISLHLLHELQVRISTDLSGYANQCYKKIESAFAVQNL